MGKMRYPARKGQSMQFYKKERVDNAILFFAQKHYKKTKKYLSQTALYKYLAFFEFRYLKKAGDMQGNRIKKANSLWYKEL